MSLYCEMSQEEFLNFQRQGALKKFKAGTKKFYEEYGKDITILELAAAAVNEEKETIFHLIAKNNEEYDYVAKLIDPLFALKETVGINKVDGDFRTPLFYAVLCGNPKIVEKLLQKGANPSIKGNPIEKDEVIPASGLFIKKIGKVSISVVAEEDFDEGKEKGKTKGDQLYRLTGYKKVQTVYDLLHFASIGNLRKSKYDSRFPKIKKLIDQVKGGSCVRAKENPQGVKEEMPNYLLKAITPEVNVHPQYGKLRY